MMTNENGTILIDLESGTFAFACNDADCDCHEDLEETEFETVNGCEYSVFEDDETEETFHIEVDPDWLWSKDDVWDLVQTLLYKIGEIDEDGDLIGNGPEKPLFVVTAPGSISEENAKDIKKRVRKALEEANIDASPLILEEGLHGKFITP